MPPAFKTKEEAQAGLTASFNPTNEAQRKAIADASALVPTSNAITPSALTQTQPITPVTTPPVTVPTAPVLPATQPDLYAPTKAENDIYSMLFQNTQDLNALGSEKGATAKANAQFGVQEKQGIVNNLKGQFDALTQEANGIELQRQQDYQNLQNNAQQGGANVTKGGLDPMRRAIDTTSNQAKLTTAIKQHQVAAQYAVANGDLGTAIQLADRAVTIEYQQEKDALDARKANIELLLKDPSLTQAQQKRADAQKQALDAQTAKINQEIQTKKDTNDARLKAINVNLTNPNLQKAMAALDAAKTPADVAGVLAFYGLDAEKPALPASAQEYEFAKKNGYTGTYTQYQNEDANRKASIAGAGAVTTGAPTSYKEWELAGKPGTYENWLKESNVKAPTVAQQTVAEYAARLEQAEPTFETLQDKITGMNFALFKTQLALPSALQTSEIQQYVQAASNFINAKLRRESGAVISPSEFAEARTQYLPAAGDSPEVLAQKKANRDLVYQSLKNAAGNAYVSVNDLLGKTALKPGASGTTASGISYTIE